MIRHRSVLSIGEVLVDFVSKKSGVNLKGAPEFAKCAGGAPANVAVGVARLGTSSSFIGKVGDDSFGHFLTEELCGSGVDARGVVYDGEHKTRLAFVSLMKNGERDFEFWEKGPADEQLRFEEIDRGMIGRASIVNVGSFLLLKNPSRRAALEAARYARAIGCEVCYDPNLRLSLWPDRDDAKRVMATMIRRSSIMRLNDTEAQFFTGSRRVETAASRLRAMGPKLVVVTLGSEGCYYQTDQKDGFVRGYQIRPVDTTGCGDGFLAGLLNGLARIGRHPEQLSGEELKAICTVANAVGALVALKRGAIAAMPTGQELRRFLERKRTK